MHVLDQASRERVDLHHKNLGPRDELSGTFHGQLSCDNTLCSRDVTVAGDWQSVFNNGDPSLGEFGDIYRLRYANPPLRMMKLPAATPKTVQDAVETAASVLWISPSSAASRLRQAVEALLTARKIKRFVIDSKGRRRRLNLHQRIELFKSVEPEVAEALLAMKWIGNDGTHEDTLDVPQVLLGARILRRRSRPCTTSPPLSSPQPSRRSMPRRACRSLSRDRPRWKHTRNRSMEGSSSAGRRSRWFSCRPLLLAGRDSGLRVGRRTSADRHKSLAAPARRRRRPDPGRSRTEGRVRRP